MRQFLVLYAVVGSTVPSLSVFELRDNEQGRISMYRRLFFLCPSGLLLAIISHLLLSLHGIVMILVHGFSCYWLAVVGYAALTVLLCVKWSKGSPQRERNANKGHPHEDTIP